MSNVAEFLRFHLGAETYVELRRYIALTWVILLAWVGIMDLPVGAWGLDLEPPYTAARLFLDGSLDAIYNHGAWLTREHSHPLWWAKVAQLGLHGYPMAFMYAPVYLLFLAPAAALLAFPAFAKFMAVVNAFSAAVAGTEILRMAGVRSAGRRFWGAALLALVFPAVYAAGSGQNDLSPLALILVGHRALHSPRRGVRALGYFALAASVAFKSWCLPVVGLVLLWGGLRRAIACGVAVAALHIALPLVLFPSLLKRYVSVLGDAGRVALVAFNDVSIRSNVRRALEPGWAASIAQWHQADASPRVTLISNIVVLAVGAVFLAIVAWRRPTTERIVVAGLAFLLAPASYCWTHYLVFLLPLACFAAFVRGNLWFVRGLGLMLLGLLYLPFHPMHASVLPHPVYWLMRYPEALRIYFALPLSLAFTTAYCVLLSRSRTSLEYAC